MTHIDKETAFRLALVECLGFSEIAEKYGVSRQRIQQIVSAPAPIRAYVYENDHRICRGCGANLILRDMQVHEMGSTIVDDYKNIPMLTCMCRDCHVTEHIKLYGG
jgi:hypothetical protein